MLRRIACFIPFFVITLIAGCGDPSARIGNPDSLHTTKASPVAALLAQAQQAPSPEAEQLMLHAIRLLREDNKIAQASNILTTIDGASLPAALQADFIIETAYLALYNQDPALSVSILTTDRMNFTNIINQLNTKQTIESSLLRAISWEESGNFLAAARERIFIAPLLADAEPSLPGATLFAATSSAPTSTTTPSTQSTRTLVGPTRPNPYKIIDINYSKQNNKQKIWFDLTALPAEDLERLSQSATFDETKGWFHLAWLFRANQDNLDAQISALNHWLSVFPTHPAANPLPESLAILSQLVKQRPNHIALLLPMSGPYSPASRAIQNGFLAAHFTDTKSANTDPDSQKLSIKVYDSSNTELFIATYQQAVRDGAELIIGALQKKNVKALQRYEGGLPVPTIALNRGDKATTNPANLYQFGLSPDDEARQVAKHASAYEHKNAAVLYPDTAWGERVFNAFNEEWTTVENTAITSATFNNKGDYSSAIKQMLMIQQSKSRSNQLKRMLGIPFEFQPRRRQDIDFVFVLATPKQARQIKPLLDFHYAADLPVYATSHAYSGTPNPIKDRDINGVEFCDIPWLLAQPTETQLNLKQAWPDADTRYGRLNALGVDAYRLHARIQLLIAVPDARFFGATGVLSLSQDNLITRELNWAKIGAGVPKLTPKILPSIDEEEFDLQNSNLQNPNLINTAPSSQGRDDEKKWNEQLWRKKPLQQQPRTEQQPQNPDRLQSRITG